MGGLGGWQYVRWVPVMVSTWPVIHRREAHVLDMCRLPDWALVLAIRCFLALFKKRRLIKERS